MPSSKNIAVFCDGTWQQIDQTNPTNVSRLARAVAPFDTGDVPQVVRYDSGIGVWSGEDVLANEVRDFGGAFGIGLDQKVMDAYQFLCLNYVPGDKIFIFGFSRGAYTARCLAGLLNLVWILKRENAERIDEAQEIYRDPRRDPKSTDKASFADFITRWTAYWCHPKAQAAIQYVGVWDTVGELGIPKALILAEQIDAKYQFYDTALSALTINARHAVSIDENRDTYSPTLWTNVDELNKPHTGQSYADRPYQQRWFPGHHSGVGGGQADKGLAVSAMKWIAEGAQRAGLVWDQSQLAAATENPAADFIVDAPSIGDIIVNAVGGTSPRMPGPANLDEVSDAACTRWSMREDYRPSTLNGVRGALAQKYRPH